MNQTEVTEDTADLLESSPRFETVGILTPIDGQPPVVLAKDLHGVTWRVSCERLAGP